MRGNRRGQVTAEMAVMFTFVITGLVFMGVYLQRATQGGMKGNTDGIGSQFSTKTGWTTKSTQATYETVVAGTTKTTTDSCSRAAHSLSGAAPALADCTPGKGSGFSGMIGKSSD